VSSKRVVAGGCSGAEVASLPPVQPSAVFEVLALVVVSALVALVSSSPPPPLFRVFLFFTVSYGLYSTRYRRTYRESFLLRLV